jgi:pimeloyl-ACP methyl ester carboxylesterase
MEENYLTVSEKPLINLRHCYFPTNNENYKNRTILLIPGWLSNIDRRMPLIKAFQKISNVIMFEPRGFGKSSGPRKRGLYKPNLYADDLKAIVEHYQLKEKKFFIWGSCIGAEIAYKYCIENKGPKPEAILAVSTASKHGTFWWFSIVNYLPYPIMWIAYSTYKIIFKIYLRRQSPEDVKNFDYSMQRFYELDFYVQARILLEFIHKFDIRGVEEKIGVPQLIMYAENDWFSKPEDSEKLGQFHSKSKLIKYSEAHRFIDGNEDDIVNHINQFLKTL